MRDPNYVLAARGDDGARYYVAATDLVTGAVENATRFPTESAAVWYARSGEAARLARNIGARHWIVERFDGDPAAHRPRFRVDPRQAGRRYVCDTYTGREALLAPIGSSPMPWIVTLIDSEEDGDTVTAGDLFAALDAAEALLLDAEGHGRQL